MKYKCNRNTSATENLNIPDYSLEMKYKRKCSSALLFFVCSRSSANEIQEEMFLVSNEIYMMIQRNNEKKLSSHLETYMKRAY